MAVVTCLLLYRHSYANYKEANAEVQGAYEPLETTCSPRAENNAAPDGIDSEADR